MIEYHALFLVLLGGSQALFGWLDVLNLQHGERTVRERAEWVAEELGIEDVEELIDYNRASTGLSRLESVVSLAFVLLVLYSGLFADVVAAVESLGFSSLLSGVVFFVGVAAAFQVVSWPFDVVNTFVIEEVFGFNEQTPRLWVRDQLLGLLISSVIVALAGAVFLWIVRTFPTLWAIGGAAGFLVFTVVMQVVYPRVIAPLFNDFVPIEEGELREAVEAVFDRAGFTCEQVYEMDASRRSSHSNAYFIGFGRTKRVVLFDTLVEQMELPQVEAVLAHELAHWKRGHVWKLLAVGTVQVGVLLAIAQVLLGTEFLYAMFGVSETTYAGLILALLWLAPVNQLTSPLTNKVSLAAEREADSFAVEVMGAGEPLADGLANLVSENLSNPFPHPWYATFHYTHPPVPDRIRYIDELAADLDGAGDDETTSGQPAT